ncbi:MAG: TonB-dependent receptor [Bacteroidota bacterium]|nr:TonB-dependent receptor [Bacteroidota bacterium]
MKKNPNENFDRNSQKLWKLFSSVGMMVLIIVLSFSAVFAQQGKTIRGTVTDNTNLPLPGVTVSVKGAPVGTITGSDGTYTIQVPATGKVLAFSFVGMKTTEVTIGNQTQINVTMVEESIGLDEVVAVGYGTQKKATLSGSVAQVRGDDVLKGKATTNIASALQGTIPGLTITRTSSRPGNEGTTITLRGGISVNATNPMIVVDGVEAYQWELSQINPNDIETVSVLKDAAASIYGTKAGAGVILITTKRGKEGKMKVTYSGSSHANVIGNRFPVGDGQTWSEMLVHATENDAYALLDANGKPQYSWWMWPEDVWRKMANGEGYEGVITGSWRKLDPSASNNQFDAVYGNTWGQSHNLTFSGGTDKLKMMTSLGYANDRSLVDVVFDGQKKYNFRTNADYKVNDWIKTEFNVSYDKRTVSTPTQGIGHGIQDFYLFPLYNPYGQFYDTFGNNNMLAKLIEGGRTNNTEELFRLGGKLTLNLDKLTEGLSVSGSANARIRKHWLVERQAKVTLYDWSGEKASSNGLPDYTRTSGSINSQTTDANAWVKNTYEDVFFQTYNAFANYNREFAGHNIGVMAGMTAEKNHYQRLYGYRQNMSVNELDDINLGDATTAQATGGSNEDGLVSYLTRLNYDYKGIYLLEGQFRRDGSSRFYKDNRWANFGGVSGGIRLSELLAVKKLNVFDNLKLRASYGETGSQTGIGNYDYISGISSGTTIFGYAGTKLPSAWVSSMTSNDRTWERVSTTNYAVDFAVLQNRLTGTFEIYNRQNKGMLISMTYPQTLGTSAPKTNNGNFTAKGWELELNWNDKIGQDFSYRVGLSLADAKTEVTKYNGGIAIANGNNNAVGANQFIEGKPLNALYVYKTDGYLQTADEVNAYYTQITQKTGGIHPVQGTTNQLTPGSVKKVDLNKDGRITTEDLYFYGDANPHYTFGVNLGASYKNFDFTMFVQGVGQQYVIREGQLSSPWFSGWTNQNATFWGNTWTSDNTNAKYPIMSRNGSRNNWNYKQYNDINVSSIWYARAKNIALGYTLPKSLLEKVSIEKLRLYMSADNIFEFSNVKDGFDPEHKAATGQGNVDVYSRTISFGIDLTF